MHHHARRLFQRRDVDAGDGGRHQAERRQHRIAAADAGHAEEYLAKVLRLGRLLQRRAWIGDGDKMPAGFRFADRVGDALEKVILENIRLGRGARLARHDEQRLAEIERAFDRLDLRRHGGVENAQARKVLFVAEHRRQDFRAEARAAHAEQERVGKSFAPDLLGEGLIALDLIGRRRRRASRASDPRRCRSTAICRAAKAFAHCRGCATPPPWRRPSWSTRRPAPAFAYRSCRRGFCRVSPPRRRAACRRRRRTAARRPRPACRSRRRAKFRRGRDRRARAARRRHCRPACRRACRGRGTHPWSRSAWC